MSDPMLSWALRDGWAFPSVIARRPSSALAVLESGERERHSASAASVCREQPARIAGYLVMRIFIGFLIAVIVLYLVDQHFAFGFYTDRVVAMLNQVARSFGV
ncbi:MAG: hypothetical protein J0H40_03590 [Rhizobiales bacterium]|nr:hypothetical protein [Hyphomicrobiales bacterium]